MSTPTGNLSFTVKTQVNETANLPPPELHLSQVTGNGSLQGFEDYIYDYNESLANIPLGEVIPVSFVYGLTLLFGLFGNFLVIFTILKYRRMRNITNVFLLSLSSADLLLILICVPVKCAAFFTFTWSFGKFLCKFVHYMQNVSMICSVMTLTAMSIERYVAILHPLRAKYLCTITHARVVIVVVWGLSVIMASPILVGQTHKPVGVIRKAHWCVKEWDSSAYTIMYELYMLVIMFVIPVGVMVVAYTAICRELWKVTSMRASMRAGKDGGRQRNEGCVSGQQRSVAPIYRQPTAMYKEVKKNSSEDDRTRKSVVQMLVVVVLLFAICWGPILLNNVLVAFDVLQSLHYGFLKPMRQAFFLMSYLNSCVNPVVYGFMSKNFRETFLLAICSCVRGGKYVRNYKYRKPMSFATRTSAVMATRSIIEKTEVEVESTDCHPDMMKPMLPSKMAPAKKMTRISSF